MGSEELLSRARELFHAGETANALTLARERDTGSVEDAYLHLQWADFLEEAGLYDQVLEELNLAVRDDPSDLKGIKRLAEVCLDQGLLDRAAQCRSALIRLDPTAVEHYLELGKIFEEQGEYEKASDVYRRGYETTGEETFRGLIRSLSLPDFPVREEAAAETGDQIVPLQHHLVTFCGLFAGREGVYARHWASPTGETGYTPVHEPFTLKVAENHILGNVTAGVYPVRLDNTVNFIAFDLDLPKPLLNRAITSESLWKKAMAGVHRAACRLVDLGASHDVTVYMEDSGFKGRHCWIFLDSPLPAGVARRFGMTLLNMLQAPPTEVGTEMFPKQGTLKPGSLGSLIKLPLGFHKKTGRRAVFIQPDGQPYPVQLEFLESVVRTSRRNIYALIQRFSQHPAFEISGAGPWEEAKSGAFPSLHAEARPRDYEIDRDMQFQMLVMKCPVIGKIAEKINREATITKEETLVIVHTVGHLEQGALAVNELLQRCGNADPTMFLKSRLKGNPMSCPKILSRVPHITSSVDCACQFDDRLNLYPTPLIHVNAMPFKSPAAAPDLTVASIHFQNLLQEYMKLRKEAAEIALRTAKCEKQLQDFFEEAGVDSVQTPMGELKQIKGDGGGVTFSLEMSQAGRNSKGKL